MSKKLITCDKGVVIDAESKKSPSISEYQEDQSPITDIRAQTACEICKACLRGNQFIGITLNGSEIKPISRAEHIKKTGYKIFD